MSCFSTVFSLLSHAPWKEMCRSIHHSTLYLCSPQSLPLCLSFFLLTHSTSFVLSPLNTASLDSPCPVPHIFVSFLPLSLALFFTSSLIRFLLFPSWAVFSSPPQVLILSPSHWALSPYILPLHLQLRLN